MDPVDVVLCRCGCLAADHAEAYDATGNQVGSCLGCRGCERFEPAGEPFLAER